MLPSAASHLPTQLSQTLQCEVRGGRNILQVKQYFSFTTCPLIITSRVRGGGRYVELPVLSVTEGRGWWGPGPGWAEGNLQDDSANCGSGDGAAMTAVTGM